MPGESNLSAKTDEELAEIVASPPVSSAETNRAFAMLYERLSRRLLSFIASRLPPRGEVSAEDVLQETWMKALKGLRSDKYQVLTETGFRSWIMTIARNCLMSHLRKKTAVPIGARQPIAADNGDGERANDERVRWLQECLEELADDWAAIVRLRLGGTSHADISQQLGIEYNTTMTRFHRAKQQLSDCVKQKSETE